MQLGSWQLDTASGGTARIDGGTMFGVVPKPLWEKLQPADELNRIRMACNCVLARDGEHTVLIDTGYGGKASDKERELMDLEPGAPLEASLETLGVALADVDTVVFSHLHFDHAGGATRYDDQGRLELTFPGARHFVARTEWKIATSGAAELRGAYPTEHFLPIAESNQLELFDDNAEILPGLRALWTGGHTRGHHALIFESQGQTAIYPGDLCPMAAHVRSHWGMAYDTDPLATRRRKPEVLGRAADDSWWVLWDHDPDHAACRLARDDKREFVVTEALPVL